MQLIRSVVVRRLIAVFALLSFAGAAQAGLVSTGAALAAERGQALDRVQQYLMQDAVQTELRSLGVSSEMALARAQALSAAELEQLAGRIAEQPAGAGPGLFEVLGITFLVLLVLEFVGVTNIFNR
jgi:hypothetical protein